MLSIRLDNLAKSADEAIIALGNLEKDVIKIYEKLDKAEEMLKEMKINDTLEKTD